MTCHESSNRDDLVDRLCIRHEHSHDSGQGLVAYQTLLSSLGPRPSERVVIAIYVVEGTGICVDDRRDHDTAVFSTVVDGHCHRGVAASGISSETEIVAKPIVVLSCATRSGG